ncbi:MAG: peptidoglycan DD-metalloendopeptidase family protein [Bacteroidales bacterium]|nr:peptidoglycan DD-metalloendopeptidase family protein [Bacteroidales bacterium]
MTTPLTRRPLLFVAFVLVQLHTTAQSSIRTKTAIDTALMEGDDHIDKFYNENKPMPGSMWYGTNFSDARVRAALTPLDSLPDEVNLRLVRKPEEFAFPVKNVITSPYGWRWNRCHRGVDILLRTGEPVRNCFPGIVRIARSMGGYGNVIVVRHYNGLETVYGHLSQIKVRPRQIVNAGDTIGLGGSTGRATGPHLHFEVRFQYETFDPEWILDFKTYSLRTRRLHLDKSYFGISQPKGNAPLAYKADKSIVKERPVAPRPLYYTVNKGDTLDGIASRYNTTKEHIKSLNNNLTRIKPGQKIRVQ